MWGSLGSGRHAIPGFFRFMACHFHIFPRVVHLESWKIQGKWLPATFWSGAFFVSLDWMLRICMSLPSGMIGCFESKRQTATISFQRGWRNKHFVAIMSPRRNLEENRGIWLNRIILRLRVANPKTSKEWDLIWNMKGIYLDSLPPQISSTMIFSTGEFVGCFEIGERLGDVLSLACNFPIWCFGWFRKDWKPQKSSRFPRSAPMSSGHCCSTPMSATWIFTKLEISLISVQGFLLGFV